jgi:hypothetical protein
MKVIASGPLVASAGSMVTLASIATTIVRQFRIWTAQFSG